MEYKNGPARKVARLLHEAARRTVSRQSEDVKQVDVQVQLQLLLNSVKTELKNKGYQIF